VQHSYGVVVIIVSHDSKITTVCTPTVWCIRTAKLTFVICALPFPGHVGIAWKLLEKQRTFGNQGLISHSEETKKGNVFVSLS